MGTNQPRVQFRIRFVEPDGRIASTLVLETGREPERFDGDGVSQTWILAISRADSWFPVEFLEDSDGLATLVPARRMLCV